MTVSRMFGIPIAASTALVSANRNRNFKSWRCSFDELRVTNDKDHWPILVKKSEKKWSDREKVPTGFFGRIREKNGQKVDPSLSGLRERACWACLDKISRIPEKIDQNTFSKKSDQNTFSKKNGQIVKVWKKL